MRVLTATNDPVRLSFLKVLLADAGIESFVLDQHASIAEGSAGAIQHRLMVSTRDYTRALRVLTDSAEL
jgi:hypothetical protein